MSTSADERSVELDAKYIKGTHYRVILAEGAWGGLSPHGLIQASFYNERRALPRRSTISQSASELVETIVDGEDGIVREFEVTVCMSLATAESFRSWLDDKIEALKLAQGDSE